MKKFFGILLALVLLISLGIVASAEGEAPSILKPVYITIVDEQGSPVSGASVQVLDSAGQAAAAWTTTGGAYTAFLPEGSYTLKLLSVPAGYVIENDQSTFTVTLEEAERRDDFVGEVTYDHAHPECCSVASHIGLELYTVHDSEGSVTAYCFNQNYDNPTPDSRYRRLVGTPELLYSLAQNKNPDITPQELYDHVLSIIYHKADVQAQFGLDDTIANYLTNMSIKNFTDPTCFVGYDNDGNSTLARDENGKPIRDENGAYVFHPGSTVLGSMINHARGDNKADVLPQEYRDAWLNFIEYTDHPSDYYLYIYYPDNFQPGNTDSFQCLMSVFQVQPIRLSMPVRSTTTIEITKQWDDGGNQDGLRPTAEEFAEMVHLLADGEDVTAANRDKLTVTENDNNTFTVTYTGLIRRDDAGEEISYQIREDEIPGYTADQNTAANGGTIVNTHPPVLTRVEVSKEWKDGDDADGLRPEQILVNLLADNVVIREAEVTPDEDGNWACAFEDLPKFRDKGVEIVYSVTEEPVENYTGEVKGFTITNTHQPETTRIDVTKKWDDGDNQDGLRPSSVTIRLLADGKEVRSATVQPDEQGNWSCSFEDLPKRAKGVEIVYTVTEDPVSGYKTKVDGFTITNTHSPEVIEIPVLKHWSDSNNKAGNRPSSITVRLLADGKEVKVATITPDAAGRWTYTFTDLPKYSQGKEIKYTITEDPVRGYYTKIQGFTIRNSVSPITGDDALPIRWAALLTASLLGSAALLRLLLRRRRGN